MTEPTQIIWSDEPGGNVEHLGEHDVSPEEAESVLVRYFGDREPSRSSDNWLVMGHTPSGRFLVVVFDYIREESIVITITAFEPQEL